MSDTESIYDEDTTSQTSLDDLRQRLEEKRDILEDMGYDFDDVEDMDEDEILDLLELAEQEEDLDEESDFDESEDEDSPRRPSTSASTSRPSTSASTSRPSTSASTSRPSTSASTSRPSTSAVAPAIPPRSMTSRVVPTVAPTVPPRVVPTVPPRVVPTVAPAVPPRTIPPRPSFVPSRRPTDVPVKEIEPSRPATKYVKPIIDTSRVELDDAWSEIDWDEAVIDNFGLVSELATALRVPKGSVKQMATRMKQKMSAYFQFRNEAGEKINATAARKLNEILEKQKSYL